VSGTYHNIYVIGSIINSILDFRILNNITWIKPAPPPNLSCRFFTHSTETILWVRKGKKSKHKFDYSLMKEYNQGKQMKDVWVIGRAKKNEFKYGKHPTQKPEELIERMVLSSTSETDLILDMFSGSGTTGAVSLKHNRRFIGIEMNNEYMNIMKKRLNGLK
jgi:site-specific DNA-methyltransferase (adenine-specific)